MKRPQAAITQASPRGVRSNGLRRLALQPFYELLRPDAVGAEKFHKFHHVHASLAGLALRDVRLRAVHLPCRFALRQPCLLPSLA